MHRSVLLVIIIFLLPSVALVPSVAAQQLPVSTPSATPEQPHVTLAEDGLWIHFAVQVPFVEAESPQIVYAVNAGDEQTVAAQQVGFVASNTNNEQAGTTIYAAKVPAGPGDEVTYQAGSEQRGYTAETTVGYPGTQSVRFIAMGDIGQDGIAEDGTAPEGSAAITVRDLAIEQDADLFIIPGDLAYQNSQGGWDRFMRMHAPLQSQVATMPTIGNHEWDENTDRGYGIFLAEYVLPGNEEDFAFQSGPVTFVGVNSDAICAGDTYRTSYGNAAEPCPTGEPDMERRARLEAMLEEAQNDTTPWTVVYMHHPPYSHGRHGNDWGNQQLWVPLFEEYGVDLVVAAHDHLYSRSYPILDGEPTAMGETYAQGDGVVYVVTGGGGRGLYDITDAPAPAWHAAGESVHHLVVADANATHLSMQAIRADGSVLDAFTITTQGAAGEEEPGEESPVPFVLVPLAVAALLFVRRR